MCAMQKKKKASEREKEIRDLEISFPTSSYFVLLLQTSIL